MPLMEWFTTVQNLPFIFTSLIWLALASLASLLIHIIFDSVFSWIVHRTSTNIDDDLMSIIQPSIFWSILVLGFYPILLSMDLQTNIEDTLRRFLFTMIAVIWAWGVIQGTRSFLQNLQDEHEKISGQRLADIVPFFSSFANLFIIFAFFLVIMNIWDVAIGPALASALASAGVLGVALAFAAKDTVANIFGGISIFFDKPYKVGDYVIVKDTYRGEIIEIGMRSTRIKTRDNILITVPNSIMVTDFVVNETGFDEMLRIRIPVGVSYDSDLDTVEEVLLDVLTSHSSILSKPIPKIRYREFSEYAVKLEVLGVMESPQNRGRVIHELIKLIHERLQKEEIVMPYPRYDIRIDRD